jgi:xanthine dehydrogenase molybdopterin-binding subunit B
MGSHLETNILPPSRQRELPGQPRKWIGQSLKRVEDRRFLLGKGQYIDDHVVPHMAHAATVRSPHAHARITAQRIDHIAANARCRIGCKGNAPVLKILRRLNQGDEADLDQILHLNPLRLR